MRLNSKLNRLEQKAAEIAERGKQEKIQQIMESWTTEELREVAYYDGEKELSREVKLRIVDYHQQRKIIETGKGYTEKEQQEIYDSL